MKNDYRRLENLIKNVVQESDCPFSQALFLRRHRGFHKKGRVAPPLVVALEADQKMKRSAAVKPAPTLAMVRMVIDVPDIAVPVIVSLT